MATIHLTTPHPPSLRSPLLFPFAVTRFPPPSAPFIVIRLPAAQLSERLSNPQQGVKPESVHAYHNRAGNGVGVGVGGEGGDEEEEEEDEVEVAAPPSTVPSLSVCCCCCCCRRSRATSLGSHNMLLISLHARAAAESQTYLAAVDDSGGAKVASGTALESTAALPTK